jgi:cell division transport system permease protein
MRAWLANHARSFAAARARLAQAPLGVGFNVLVIAIALSFPAGLYSLIDNLRASARQLGSGEPQLSVFLALDAARADVAQIEARLKRNAQVRQYRFVPREEALQELKQASGVADLADSLTGNPLPDAFIVAARSGGPEVLEALRDEIRQWPRVAHVQLDAAWARRLDAGLRLGEIAAAFLAAVLGIALVAVTFNTIRLQVLTQREEIEVTQLIGATDAFIRRPFLYFGTLQGLAGGFLACAFVDGAIYLLNRNLSEVSRLYATLFQLRYPDLIEAGCLLVLAGFLGWLGAWLAVRRHLVALRKSAAN